MYLSPKSVVFLFPQTEAGDHESNAKPSAYVIFSSTVQQLWSMSGKKKKKRDGGLIQGWGIARVCVAGGQGKKGVEGADEQDRWRR